MMVISLSACHKVLLPAEEQSLPFKVAGANDKNIKDWQRRLNHHGVRVLTVGQDYLIAIPSAVLFPSESPQLTWDSYGLLNAVACYLKQFRKISISVTAYSNKCVSAQRDNALTLARARAVGDYLWSQGVDSRFIFTQGQGSDKPILATQQTGDNSMNSRIEIRFRDAVA